MNNERYRKAIERTMNGDLTEKEKLSMLLLGMAGELGEIVDGMKKVLYHDHPLDLEDLTEELGDFEYYMQHFKKHFGISDEKIRMVNIQKLQKRYPDGFSSKASLERVDTLPDK
jgi:NTP pyrophosphatase (non-canonical NTP hydrolase)